MRLGHRVTVEGDRIVADYSSTSPDGDEDVFMHVGTSPPIRAGTYFIAVSNCGPEPADFELHLGGSIIDFFSPAIFRAEVIGESLIVHGLFFENSGGKLFLNGKNQKHISHDEDRPGCALIAERAGRKIAPGETVKLQIRFPSGLRTNKFKFTRPVE
jgi:hypothetical protein